MNHIKLLFILTSLLISACTIQGQGAYRMPITTVEPVFVYPPEPFVGETIIINDRPYYRHYHNGRYYYHHHHR